MGGKGPFTNFSSVALLSTTELSAVYDQFVYVCGEGLRRYQKTREPYFNKKERSVVLGGSG